MQPQSRLSQGTQGAEHTALSSESQKRTVLFTITHMQLQKFHTPGLLLRLGLEPHGRATCSCVVVCDHTQQAGKEMKWKHEKGGPTGTAAPAQKAAGRQSSHAAHRGSACPAKRSLNQMTAAGAGVQHGSAPQVHTAQHTARRILGTCPERGSEEAATTTTWHITSAVLAARGPRRVLCGSGQHTRTLFLSSSCCWAVVVR
jgi:hypothetical protein